MSPGGIGYEKDLVTLISGIDENYIETVNLKEKKVKQKKQDEEEGQ